VRQLEVAACGEAVEGLNPLVLGAACPCACSFLTRSLSASIRRAYSFERSFSASSCSSTAPTLPLSDDHGVLIAIAITIAPITRPTSGSTKIGTLALSAIGSLTSGRSSLR